jgi:hypothetical protein
VVVQENILPEGSDKIFYGALVGPFVGALLAIVTFAVFGAEAAMVVGFGPLLFMLTALSWMFPSAAWLNCVFYLGPIVLWSAYGALCGLPVHRPKLYPVILGVILVHALYCIGYVAYIYRNS